MQEVLSVITKNENVRSQIQGWTHEDPTLYVHGKGIGYTQTPSPCYTPKTILQALADGWKLLGPPQPFKQKMWSDYHNTEIEEEHYSWWLVKDKD